MSTVPLASSGARGSVALVLNPSSGLDGRQAHVRHAAARLPEINIREVGPSRGAEHLARQSVRDGARVLAACGGDGTISAVATVAVENDLPMGGGSPTQCRPARL